MYLTLLLGMRLVPLRHVNDSVTYVHQTNYIKQYLMNLIASVGAGHLVFSLGFALSCLFGLIICPSCPSPFHCFKRFGKFVCLGHQSQDRTGRSIAQSTGASQGSNKPKRKQGEFLIFWTARPVRSAPLLVSAHCFGPGPLLVWAHCLPIHPCPFHCF